MGDGAWELSKSRALEFLAPELDLRARKHVSITGGYARIYLKITILEKTTCTTRAARACMLAARAKVGGMRQM
jgi:hypothetical protein